jgi:pimeloyl-ACP methyl ester carboxylesterase
MKISSSLIKVSFVILIMVILTFAFLDRLVRFMTYPAPSVDVPFPPPQPFREIQIHYAAQDSINCWLHENEINTGAPILLIFHGNGENSGTMYLGGLLQQFINLNVHFLAVDYPGYGRSDGKPSEENIIASANAAFRWIEEKYPDNPKIVFGWSLGAAVAIQTCANHTDTIRGLIAVSPWTSLADVAAVHYPRFLVNSLLKEKYNSMEAAKEIKRPALLIHGDRDNIIPFIQGKKVAQAMGSTGRFVPVANAGHNDIFSREIVWNEIASFIQLILEK